MFYRIAVDEHLWLTEEGELGLPAFVDSIINASPSNAFTATVMEPTKVVGPHGMTRVFAFIQRHTSGHAVKIPKELFLIPT